MINISSWLNQLQFCYHSCAIYFSSNEKSLNFFLEESNYSKILKNLPPNKNINSQRLVLNLFKNYTESHEITQDSQNKLLEKLIELDYFVSDYYFNNDNENWLHFLIQKQNQPDHKKYNFYKNFYKKILQSEKISDKDKSLLELGLLKTKIEKDAYYYFNEKERKNFSNIIQDVSNIISNGFIFKNKLTSFRSLLWILSNNVINQNLAPQKIRVCLENFAGLNSLAKKVILKSLINKKQETIILNLFSHGINLDWKIDFNGDGKKEVCSLKIFQDLKLSDYLLSSDGWNVMVKKQNGDNLLHMMCGSSLLDKVTINYLHGKVRTLRSDEQTIFLNEKNNNGLSPILQAILLQDEQMVNFMISYEIEKWNNSKPEEISALKFLKDCIEDKNNHLLPEFLTDTEIDKKFWINLLGDWESEKLNKQLENQLEMKKDIHSKLVKI